MRLYAAFRRGDLYPAENVKASVLSQMERRGHVERHGEAVTLTRQGIAAWGRMIGQTLEETKMAQVSPVALRIPEELEYEFNELKDRLGTSRAATALWIVAQYLEGKLVSKEAIPTGGNCDLCVSKRVLDIVRERLPEIGELEDSMRRQAEVLSEMERKLNNAR